MVVGPISLDSYNASQYKVLINDELTRLPKRGFSATC